MKAKRIIKSGLALLLSMQLALMSCITALAAPECQAVPAFWLILELQWTQIPALCSLDREFTS